MVENPKYPMSELTGEDIEILDRIIIIYAVKSYAIMKKYTNAMQYAKKILKELSSGSDVAGLFTLAYAKNDSVDRMYKPVELNQRLANDLRNIIEGDYEAQGGREVTILLHRRDLRERVLKMLETLGVFMHLEGKQEIKRHEHKVRTPRKKGAGYQNGDDRGGNPSAYMMTKDFVKIRKTIEKAAAVEYIHARLISSGLALVLTKHILLAFLHAAKMDKKAFITMMTMGAKFMNDSLTEDDTNRSEVSFQNLQSCTDTQMQAIAENLAKFLMNNRSYYEQLVFFIALMKDEP
ncbi:MAG: hypothetical protein WB988_23255 [Candidatus Nitrosopolaris sp.]